MTIPSIELPLDAPSGMKGTIVSTESADNRPDTPHPAYQRMKPHWEKCRTLMGGTDAIRDGGQTFLPQFPREADAGYLVRKKLVALFNGYERTVMAVVGILLSKDPVIGDDMPAEFEPITEDVTLTGMHLDVYANQIAVDGTIDGHVGSLVDWPRVDNPDTLSADDEQRAGLRPFVARYAAEDILKMMWGKARGGRVLTLLVLQEKSEELVGDFGVREVTRYRVYRQRDIGITWELWEKDASGTGTTRTVDPRPILGVSRIPFSRFAPGKRLGEFETRPPLENLADLNIEHHQVKTNIRHLETLAFVPTQVRIGAQPVQNSAGEDEYPEIVLGPDKTIEVPYQQGIDKPIYWHQPDVTVLEPGNRSLQEIKADMGAAGLAFLAPDKRAAETAEAKRIDAQAQNATISSMSRALQDHLEEVYGFMAEFLSARGDKVTAGSIALNRDFEAALLDPAMLAALTSAASAGKLSIETFLSLLERFRLLPDGFDKQAEVRRILLESALPNDDGNGGGA